MKVDLTKLTKDDIERMEEWLRAEDKDYCPWGGDLRSKEFWENKWFCRCGWFFTKITRGIFGDCPCDVYPPKYVIRRGRKFVKEWRNQCLNKPKP